LQLRYRSSAADSELPFDSQTPQGVRGRKTWLDRPGHG
jgi:hypothetical protein